MPNQPDLRAPVTLECSLDVNGITYVSRQAVSRVLWDDDPAARAHAEDVLRRRLGEHIARELNPPVRVIEHDDAVWASLTERTEG
ncbi:hypothetical protein AB0E82_01950 [Streptomyces anulatus]|uniref:hypothetical protein n=1 Tax=Streptomyces anulatus TaxID=1892 RepID=UPI0033CD53D1